MSHGIKSPLLRFVVQGHAVLALGAALQVWWIGAQWLGDPGLGRIAAAFLAAFACYGYARLMRSREAALAEVPLFAWYRMHAKAMYGLVAACTAVALGCLADELPDVLVRLWPVIIPALAYVTPFRFGARAVGLRSVPGLKSLLVAWVWAGGTVLLAADGLSGLALMLMPVLGCFYWAIAIAFDVRDSHVDPPGLRTLPQLLGTRSAKVIALLLLLPLAAALVLRALWTAHGHQDLFRLMPVLGLAGCALLIASASPERGWAHWLLLDGSIALIPLLALLGGMG